jgi:hypothetical protein
MNLGTKRRNRKKKKKRTKKRKGGEPNPEELSIENRAIAAEQQVEEDGELLRDQFDKDIAEKKEKVKLRREVQRAKRDERERERKREKEMLERDANRIIDDADEASDKRRKEQEAQMQQAQDRLKERLAGRDAEKKKHETDEGIDTGNVWDDADKNVCVEQLKKDWVRKRREPKELTEEKKVEMCDLQERFVRAFEKRDLDKDPWSQMRPVYEYARKKSYYGLYIMVNAYDKNGTTALFRASQKGDWLGVRDLMTEHRHLDVDAKMRPPSEYEGQTAADAAAAGGHRDITNLINEWKTNDNGTSKEFLRRMAAHEVVRDFSGGRRGRKKRKTKKRKSKRRRRKKRKTKRKKTKKRRK